MTNRMQDVLNVNHPDYRGRVDADKYDAMKIAMEALLPREIGLTQSEMVAAIKQYFIDKPIDGNLFPNGEKVGWWAKSVQLDLEARGQMKRIGKSPLRFIWVD